MLTKYSGNKYSDYSLFTFCNEVSDRKINGILFLQEEPGIMQIQKCHIPWTRAEGPLKSTKNSEQALDFHPRNRKVMYSSTSLAKLLAAAYIAWETEKKKLYHEVLKLTLASLSLKSHSHQQQSSEHVLNVLTQTSYCPKEATRSFH